MNNKILFYIIAFSLILINCKKDDDGLDQIQVVIADFEVDDTNIAEGTSLTYSSLINENVTSYQWIFEGGTPSVSNDKNPEVVYNTPGTYFTSLKVSSLNDSDEKTVESYITVSEFIYDVTASFTQDNSTIVEGNTVTYTSTSNTNVDSWSWSFPGGTPSTSTDQNPVVTYPSAGTFDVSLTVNSTNDSDSETVTGATTVEAFLEVNAAFTADSTSVDEGETITYSVNDDTNITSYSWVFEGGTPATSNSPNPIVTYNTPGIYDVSLTVDSSNDSDASSVTDYVTIIDILEVDADFTAVSTSLTVGDSTSFSVVDNTNILTYAWTFSGGTPSSSNAPNPSITYSSIGTYDVSLTVTSSNSNDVETKTGYITVSNVLSPVIVFTESFETNGTGSRYMLSTADFSDGTGGDFFCRTNRNGANDDLEIKTSYNVTGEDGSFYFAAMDMDGDGNAPTQTMLFDDVDISGVSSLELEILIAEDDDAANQDWDDDTYFYIEVDIDNSGTFTKILQISALGGTNTEPGIDDDFDGFADNTTMLNDTFQNFMKSITGTGSVIDIRLTFDALASGDEDIAIDKVVLKGMM